MIRFARYECEMNFGGYCLNLRCVINILTTIHLNIGRLSHV